MVNEECGNVLTIEIDYKEPGQVISFVKDLRAYSKKIGKRARVSPRDTTIEIKDVEESDSEIFQEESKKSALSYNIKIKGFTYVGKKDQQQAVIDPSLKGQVARLEIENKKLREEIEGNQGGYESYIDHLTGEMDTEREARRRIAEIKKHQEKEIHRLNSDNQRLLEDNKGLFKTLEKMSTAKVEPVDVALRSVMEQSNSVKAYDETFDKLFSEIDAIGTGEILAIGKMPIIEYANRVLGAANVTVSSEEELDSLEANMPEWENSEQAKGVLPEYLKAQEELKFLSDLNEGRVGVPKHLIPSVTGMINKEADETIVKRYETEKTTYEMKRKMSSEAKKIRATHAKSGEFVRKVDEVQQANATINYVVSVGEDKDSYTVSVFGPRGDPRSHISSFIGYHAINAIKNVSDIDNPDVKGRGNITEIGVKLPKSSYDAKSVVQLQRSVADHLKAFGEDEDLGLLGFKVKVTNIENYSPF